MNLLPYCHGNKPENRQYLDGCHDFCATGDGGYLNAAVECSLDTSELQNFINKPRSTNDEKPVWNLLCLRGVEREGGRKERGEEEKGGGKRKGRGERRGGSKREERKEEEREEVSINSFPVWSVLHVQYKCKALKMLTTGGRGKERERGGRR